MKGEFDLIKRYFAQSTHQRNDVALGIGDDCALLQPPPDQQIATSIDTLVCGRHFLVDVDPTSLGHKALAVNLSDLAAMGAEPAWVMLSLTLPDADQGWRRWLQAFMAGFSALAQQYQMQLIGGDTTRGPLSITVQVQGFAPPDQTMRRGAAKVGDHIYVSGTLGDAGLALELQQQSQSHPQADILRKRLDLPIPRVELGLALRGIAHAAIDISDGLGADLGHICVASGVGAQLQATALPLSTAVAEQVSTHADWRLPLNAGDDYELLFTALPNQAAAIAQAASQSATPIKCIGEIQSGQELSLTLPDGRTLTDINQGYDHFNDV